MIITNKFDYKPLKRVDTGNGRRYIVGEGRPLPSVTTILSKTQDMTHLLEWRANVGEKEATRITTEASGLGTGMHNNIENYILDKPMTGSFMAKSLANLIIKKGISKVSEVWGTEVSLYSTGLYAGTTDLVGLHDGIPSIMDYKNSLKEKRREWIEGYFMQLCAYTLSHNEMFGTDIHRGVIMIATRDAKYQEFVIEGDEFTHYETKWANTVCDYYDRFGIC
jgi:genome maintenance exonuclease 1